MEKVLSVLPATSHPMSTILVHLTKAGMLLQLIIRIIIKVIGEMLIQQEL
jgi:hypothetical protein